MIGALRVISGPTVEPLTVAELQTHSRITEDGEDFLLESYLVALRVNAEKILDLAFCTQTLEWALDAFPCPTYFTDYSDPQWAAIELPRPPLQSVTSISYVDTAGATQVLSSALYLVDTRSTPGRIVPAYGQTWPSIRYQPSAVVVRFVAGVADPADVPEDQKQMLRLAVATLNENRESIVEGAPQSIGVLEQFFAPYRNALAV